MSNGPVSRTVRGASPSACPPLTRLKRVLFSLSTVGLTGLLVLVLGEATFRGCAAYDAYRAFKEADSADDIWASYDPVLGYRLSPAFDDHNAAGRWDRPVPPRTATAVADPIADFLRREGLASP